jgi:hypothetical protein
MCSYNFLFQELLYSTGHARVWCGHVSGSLCVPLQGIGGGGGVFEVTSEVQHGGGVQQIPRRGCEVWVGFNSLFYA